MSRLEVPWYRWRISWRHTPWVFGSAIGVWGAWFLIGSGNSGIGVVVLLISLALLWGSLSTLWRNRQPFVFSIRGNRKIKVYGAGRDETIIEEDGRKVRVFTELSGPKAGRAIYPNSIQKYEAPHDGEMISEEEKKDLFDLLCEEFEYRGARYEVIMTSTLSVKIPCPRCREEEEFEIQLPFGRIGERHYRIGDKIDWQLDRPIEKGGRPDNGNLRKEVWIRCPKCLRDCWMIVSVIDDRIEKLEVDVSRTPMIPDSSIPVIEDGKLVGHQIESKNRRP